jgi:hypothetical protein
MERTPAITVDKDFRVNGEIVKSWEDDTGRYIRGVASGVEEDRDGERMSKACIESMVAQINKGDVTLNGLHQDDWLAEIGQVVKGHQDEDTDQLVIDTKLPPEGEDPIADKAWNKMAREGKKLGFSVGGKLRKAFYERNDLGKRRKVLDDISLKHVMLTQKPAYQHSFAEAVAKTFDVEPDEWFEDDGEQLELLKAAPFAGGDTDSESGQDSKTGDRNAGSRKKGAKMRTDEGDDDDQDDEPAESQDDEDKQRRLACPNCGHEFAAPMETDEDDDTGDFVEEKEREVEENNNSDRKRANKSRVERTMQQNLTEALDVFKKFVDEHVEPEPDDTDADTEDEPVAKTDELTERIDELEGQLAEAFELVAKSQYAIQEQLAELPRGRQSVARVLPPRSDDSVEKSLEDRLGEIDNPLEALKLLNAERGIE